MAKTKRTQTDRWQPVFYEMIGGKRPAWDFLAGEQTPIDVRIELLTTADDSKGGAPGRPAEVPHLDAALASDAQASEQEGG